MKLLNSTNFNLNTTSSYDKSFVSFFGRKSIIDEIGSDIVSKYRRGIKISDIKLQLDCSISTIYRALRVANIEFAPIAKKYEEKIIGLQKCGAKPKEIASAIECSSTSIYRALKKLDSDSVVNAVERKNKIIEMRKAGMTEQKIANKIGYSQSYVSTILAQMENDSKS